MSEHQKLCIIGAGASGLVSAYLLEDAFDVTLLERKKSIGGNIIAVPVPAKKSEKILSIEPGFHMMHPSHHKSVLALLKILHIEVEPITTPGAFKYNVFGTDDLYHGTRINLSRLRHRILLVRYANKLLHSGSEIVSKNDYSVSLTQFIQKHSWITKEVVDLLIGPIIIAWGLALTSGKAIVYDSFPAILILQFFHDLGLHKWESVFGMKFMRLKNGADNYVEKLRSSLSNTTIKTNYKISKIVYNADKLYEIFDENGDSSKYSHIVFTIPPAEIIKMMPDISSRKTLEQMSYLDINTSIHSDVESMPVKRNEWSFYYKRLLPFGQFQSSMWQGSTDNEDVFVQYQWESMTENKLSFNNLNSQQSFQYPIVTIEFINARKKLMETHHGQDNIYYAGYYTNGLFLHEAAYQSAISIAQQLNKTGVRLQNLKTAIEGTPHPKVVKAP